MEWKCGLYCRLSVEDNNNRESNSIQSQKIILSNFIESLKDSSIKKVYVDDGYSGSNFNRPDFIKMINDIENGIINCVVVKDYSRFGRDYIDVGYYVEKYFPDKNVRFISVNDNHDSLFMETENNLKMPIMNMFNDLQSRETSKKVRSGLKARKQEGKFIGAFAPYGYLKSKEDKNKLIIDENVEHIIKQIFSWRTEGYSTYAINNKLNEMNISTPTEYKNSIGIKHNPVNVKSKKISFWNETTVRKILSNEAYIGNTVQNKRTTKNHRTKEIINLDESKWIRVNNTHKAIIDINTWEKVQSMSKKRTRISPKSKKLNIFAGIVKCADCGYTMVRKSNGKGYAGYTCSTHISDKNKCSTHTISEKVLIESVFVTVMFQVKLATDISLLIDEIRSSYIYDNKMKIYEKTLSELIKNKDFKVKLLNDIYIDLKKDLISETQYKEIKKSTENELKDLELKIFNLKNEKPKDDFSNDISVIEIFNKFENKKELTREMILELIDCIYINEDKSIKIDFKFADEFENAINLFTI